MVDLRVGALLLFLGLFLGGQALLAESASAGPCDPPNNAIVCENSKSGNPPAEWDVSGAGDPNIQGFATDISVDQGETLHFKVDTPSTDYQLDIYRMGYYGGDGARWVAAVQPAVTLPQSQPACDEEPSTGLVDCGNWSESASWSVPTNAVSGIYFAKLEREDQFSEGSHILFIVRDDDGESDLLFQTADTTWQAYNRYGGNSLYTGSSGVCGGRACKVSYNRPFTTRGSTPEDSPFNAEYPMVRWLERNGYDVSYFTGVDVDRAGTELLEHEAYLSVGHDEYWSGQQRANVEAARDAGVHLAFFSGNEIFWKTRWEESIDGSSTDHGTLVSYKETHANAKIDPEPNVWTGTWRDPRFSPPADGGRPENELSGTNFAVNSGTAAIKVPAADGAMRLWRNTNIAALEPGETATLEEDTLGYEWDEDPDNGFRPGGLVRLSSTTVEAAQRLLDHGSNYGPGTVTHHLTLYRAPSGALVFGAGTIQWSWGLDGEHDRGESTPDSRMQQATVNLLADMGAQPGSLQGSLVSATATTDASPPQAAIATPAGGAEVESGEPITISGSATDNEGESEPGGKVGAVEVSIDGGQTWRVAEGRENWTYSWTPSVVGEAAILARAIDDSGNIEFPGDEVSVDVVPQTCPCSIWGDAFSGPQDPDTNAVELGVKFRTDVPGFITGLRYYKTPGNGGTHVGHLWTSAGAQLAEVTFTGETASGWQQAIFDSPVAIDANTTYVASYRAPTGHYASISSFFSDVGFDNPPLHALADGADGPNGIFKYGPSGGLFAGGAPIGFNSENYLVDVVFDNEPEPDTNPPTVNNRSPAAGITDVSVAASVSADFDEAMDSGTINGTTVELRDPSSALVPATVSYGQALRKVTLDPEGPLQLATTYTVTIKGGPGGVSDLPGNPLAANETWSFTTVTPPPPPPDDGPGGPILVISNVENSFSRYYTEILRAEGLNEFTATDISNTTPAVLESRDVAILGEGPLSAGQVEMLTDWVQQGGNLIAMRPDAQLASLLGLTDAGGTLGNAYLQVDTDSSPGAGIVDDTVQFHGTADRYTLAGAQAIATLYSGVATPTPNPAVTLRSVGPNGGHASAFSYDLAKSVVYTRQGNPAWAGQERDGASPIRSVDLFFGGKPGDVQADWVNLDKVAIPQADEQQRLLTNLIETMNLDRKPLPRFWFLPRDKKAAVVMTGDDHGSGGTVGRFEKYRALDPPGCVAANWECIRSTSYIYPNTPITDTEVADFLAEGFEIALHVSTNCSDWIGQPELGSFVSSQLEEFVANFPNLPAPSTNRTHCIVWSDWASQPKVELENGIRLDTNYYYWPPEWVQDRPGMFTGSGMPMRFADLDGSMIDVYQAATQMTDESGQSFPFTIDTLLDRALGPEGYYGVFTANMHTDSAPSAGSDAIVASAQARGVPIVSARQMLTWLDGRNQSSFGSINWNGDELTFTISPGAGANGLRAMVPTTSAIGPLVTVERNASPVATTTRTIKGVEYAFFDAAAGNYTATYLDEALPVISNIQVAAKNDGTATVSWDTNELADSRVDYGETPGSLVFSESTSELVTAHSVQLSGLEPNVTYHFRITSADGEANSTTEPELLLPPQSFATPPPDPVLTATAPVSPANGNSPKVVGSAVMGTTVDLYAGADCSGAPIATTTAAELATGIEVAVTDNSTTPFHATATSGAGTSACSSALTYVEDSSAPETAIDSSPPALTNNAAASFAFSGEDPGGSGLASFQCRRDAEDWSSCTSPRNYSALAEGPHTLEVRAIDAAGNADQTPAASSWSVDTTPPAVGIDSGPSGLTNDPTPTFTFHAEPGAGVECSIDTGTPDFKPCSDPGSHTPAAPLGDGPHIFRMQATDAATNQASASRGFTVDAKTPETQIDSSPASVSPSTSATFTFSGSDLDGSGVASLQCRLDSSAPGDWASCTSAKEYTALTDGPHKFEVRAIDAGGNADQTPATFNWTIDTVAPDTAIVNKPPALTNNAAASFTFTGSDGGSGVTSFECRLDSSEAGDWATCSIAERTMLAWARGPIPSRSGRSTRPATPTAVRPDFTWIVDTIAPQTQIDSSPPALTNNAAASFAFRGDDPGGSGVASFECRRDAEDWSSCTSPRNYSALAEGPHTFEVRAIDAAGNADQTPAASSWSVDTTPPAVGIDSGPSGLTNDPTPTFTFHAEPGAGVECSIDTGTPDFKPCSDPGSHTPAAPLGDGPHIFRVQATDAATNQASASRGFTVDAKTPETQIDSSRRIRQPKHLGYLHVLGLRPRWLGRRLLRMPPRLGTSRRLAALHLAAQLHRPGRGPPHLRSARDRQSRQHRWLGGELCLGDRHQSADHPARLRPGGPHRKRRSQIRVLGLRCGRLWPGLLPVPP